MRILLVTTGLKVGGAEQQVAALARQFAELGHAVAVVCLRPGHEVHLPPSIATVMLDMRKTPYSMASALLRFRSFSREWRPDIIHAHMVHANLFARVYGALFPAPPILCTAHSVREGGRLLMLAYRLTDRWSRLNTHVSAQGREAMIHARAVSAARIVVMPNGIDTAQFCPDAVAGETCRKDLGLGQDDRLILNVGRLAPEKSQALLIEAFASLDADSRTRLMIAGNGSERDALAQAIRRHGLEGRVMLPGVRRDITALLNAADLFVLSSDIEGMPLALGEALACACPVVSTDAAGVADLLGECGEIVPRGNVQALASAMRRALEAGPGTPAQQAARRQRIVSRFGLQSVAGRWLACYARLLAPATVASAEPV
ncbi:glycosyltransferase [Cupriavidus sp. CuC1]|uniref:glycosyltransferase n=1 Tax=Cupriavidus sp. CuC1 TaxID=3373131 RepID=UPI0037D9547E